MTTEKPPAAPTPTGIMLPSHHMHSAITHTSTDHAKGNIHALVQGMKANSHWSSWECRPSKEQTTSQPCAAFTQRICRRVRSLRMYLSSEARAVSVANVFRKWYSRDTHMQRCRHTCTVVWGCQHPAAVCPLDRSCDGPASYWCRRCSTHVHKAPGGGAPTRLDTHSREDLHSHSPQTCPDHSPSCRHKERSHKHGMKRTQN